MREFQVAVNLRQAKTGLMFHSDNASQCSKRFQSFHNRRNTIVSMSV